MRIRLILSGLIWFGIVGLLFTGCEKKPLTLNSFPKIDAHVHLHTLAPAFFEQAQHDHFHLLTIATGSGSQERIDEQVSYARSEQEKFPGQIAWATTFSMENWGQPDWHTDVIEKLRRDFEVGAIAVKVWKDIGMTFRDSSGKFIMIDDPAFDPIFDFIADQNKTVVAHIAEPKNCWLPLDSMTTNNDRSYFKEHPEYHMYLHPDYPSHETLMAARDHVLAKHPNLRMVGAHLASLEWDVDVLAERFERYPNLAVDLSARTGNLQVQNRDKLRAFFLRYQDRILYGTDLIINENTPPEEVKANVHRVWQNHWQYFATNNELTAPEVNGSFQGLKLDETVLRKIYYKNALVWYPGIVE